MPRRRARMVVLVVLAVFAVAAGVAIPVALRLRSDADSDAARAAVQSFAQAWRAGDLASVRYSGASGADAAKAVATATAGLTPAAKDLPAAVDVLDVGDVGATAPDTARARLRVRWALGGERVWTYETSVDARRANGVWGVAWTPAVVHPSLRAGQALVVQRTAAERGRILGARGEELAGPRAVVVVGIEPRRADDRAAAAAALAKVVDVDATDLTRRVKAAGPTAFVEAITLRSDAYKALAPRLASVPGLVTRKSQLSLGRTKTFARALLGSAGQATKELVSGSGGRIRAGDVTGIAGLQRTYDAVLAGTPGLAVHVTGQGAPDAPLFTAPAAAGADLQLTLDVSVQDAAEAALAEATKPAALVAVRASTGEVLAVANGGPDAAGVRPGPPRAVPARFDLQGRLGVRAAAAGIHRRTRSRARRPSPSRG